MTVVRDSRQAALAELQAVGAGLLVRYRELLDSGIDPALGGVLSGIVYGREPLLNRLAALAGRRDDQPTAADQERNEYRAIADRASRWVEGEQGMLRRIVEDERDWRERLERASGLSWEDGERRLFIGLEGEAEQALRRLQALAA